MKPKFYKNTFTIVVLSETPLDGGSLGSIEELVDNGPCVLLSNTQRERAVTGKTMANLLLAAGSEPEFFNLDDQGNLTDKN